MRFNKQAKSNPGALKIIFFLMVIAAISGAILASVFSATKEKIAYQQKQKIENAIISILPETEEVIEIEADSQIFYKCKNGYGELEGVAFIAQGPGYQDLIKVLVVTDTNLTLIKGIEILESVETPGLGDKITKTEFKSQFKDALPALKLSKEVLIEEEEEALIQAITGATISSQAVIDIVNVKMKQVKDILEINKKINEN